MKALIWKEENLGAEIRRSRNPRRYAEKAPELRTQLVEMAVEEDEKLLEAYLEGSAEPSNRLKALHPQGRMQFRFVPVLCGAAFKNKGVQPLLDAVIDYLPSPLDIPAGRRRKPHSE